jgi:hypothetical protein
MKISSVAALIVVTLLCLAPAMAQEPAILVPAPPQPAGGRKLPAPVPLRVTVALSRFQGEKRISSMPYVIGVMASGWGAGPKTTLRMGVDVPVTTTVFGGPSDGKSAPQSSYSYRNVGTNIDCSAQFDEANAGIFALTMTVSDSSIGLDASKKTSAQGVVPDIPSFRNFNSSFTALLRDGQTTQYTSATDPVTGELMKIDVTLNVMK